MLWKAVGETKARSTRCTRTLDAFLSWRFIAVVELNLGEVSEWRLIIPYDTLCPYSGLESMVDGSAEAILIYDRVNVLHVHVSAPIYYLILPIGQKNKVK